MWQGVNCAYWFFSTWHKLELSGKSGLQFRNGHCHEGKHVVAFYVLLFGKAHITVDCTSPHHMLLGWITKHAEQDMDRKQLSRVPLLSLLQFLPPNSFFDFLLCFPSMMNCTCKSNKSFFLSERRVIVSKLRHTCLSFVFNYATQAFIYFKKHSLIFFVLKAWF